MIRRIVTAAIAAGALAPAAGLAGEPTPEHTFTGNVGLFSQYIFRGLAQTDRDPALQGGFDYSHASGLYLGTWASNISWLRENASTPPNTIQGTYNRGGSLEWDFYGGYKKSFGDFGLDVGTLYYWYPGRINPAIVAASAPNDVPRADTWEVYVGASWKFVSAKLSVSVMDRTFGVKDTAGTTYLDLAANVPLGDYYQPLTGLTLNAHWGWQNYTGTDPRNFVVGGARLSNDDLYSYYDVKLGLSYALPKDFMVGAFWSKAYDANVLGYGAIGQVGAGGNTGPFPRNIGASTGTVFIQKTF
jgi:uncharacterized protein (TIGR02001 family)